MKQAFAALLFVCLGMPVLSGNPDGVIRGRVFDLSDGKGLPGAYIILRNDQGTMSTDSGFYYIRVKPGNISLTFRYTGYRSLGRNVRVTDGDTVRLDAGMETEVAEIDQVVVSADRIEQRISELAVSLSIIKPEVVTNSHITDAQELINKTSGIEVLDGQASVRGGSGFSYGAGSRVLALIDGLPIVAADAGNIKWQFLPLDQISQVEVIKGASSVTYGSSALNGIVNFRTADASNTPVTKFYAESLVYDRPRNKNWIWWDTPRFNTATSFSHLQRWGKTDVGIGANILFDNGYRKFNEENLGKINLKLKHRNGKIEGLVYGVTINAGIIRKTDFVQWENGITGALVQNPSTAIQLHGSFLAVDPFISFGRKELFKHELRSRLQSSVNNFPESPKNNSQAYNFYSEYQFSSKITHWFRLIAGESQNFSRVNSHFYGDHSGLNLGTFTQAELVMAQRLKFVAGIRAEYNSLDGNGDKLVPLFRTGLNYKAAGYTFLRASFGQGYRYPAIAEKFASTTLGTVKIFPNPFVESESGWNSEIGIKQGIRIPFFQGQADLAFFYSHNKNMIEYLFGIYPDPVDGSFGYGFKAANRETSRVYGFELEYSLFRKSDWMTTSINGGYVFMVPAEVNAVTGHATGVMLKYRRKHSVVFNLNNSFNKIDAGISLFVKSKILNIDDVFLNEVSRESILPGFYDYWIHHNKGYLLLDANAGYSLSDNLRLSIVLKNVTNTEYMGRPGDIQPQRSCSLRLSGKF